MVALLPLLGGASRRRLVGMTLLMILAVLSAIGFTATLWSVIRHDPPRELPRSHPIDRDEQPPSSWAA